MVSFYQYVNGLNLNDEINFFQWKSLITKRLPAETITQPFGFMRAKPKAPSEQSLPVILEDNTVA